MSLRCKIGIHDDEWVITLSGIIETDEGGSRLIKDKSRQEHKKLCTRCGRRVYYAERTSLYYVKTVKKEKSA